MASGDGAKFLGRMLHSPNHVGAVAPSSAALAREMLRGINLADGSCVVEFGPGTGPITREIQRVIASPDRYLGIERDEKFYALLTERFPAMRFVHGSAEHAARHVREAALSHVRAIISGLPFASLPAAAQEGIVGSLDELMKPGVVFRTFQYFHSLPLPAAIRFRKRMRGLFGPCTTSRVVLANIPPAVVFSWERR